MGLFGTWPLPRPFFVTGSRWHGLSRMPLAAALFLIAFIGVDLTQAEPKFPPLQGPIMDEARLLSPEDRAAIQNDQKDLEAKSTDQLVVYTTNSLQGYPIEDFGYQLGRAWGIGQKETNNGVVLIVAPTERKVRIEVGRGLEPQLTDLLSKLIIENAILPRFRRGDFSGGIRAGVHDIHDALLGDAEAVKQRAAARKTTARKAPAGESIGTLIFIVIIFLVIFWIEAQQARSLGRYRRSGDGNVIFIPGGWGGSGSWRGGGGGGGSGGGWSGGGGDFGGGGASGSW